MTSCSKLCLGLRAPVMLAIAGWLLPASTVRAIPTTNPQEIEQVIEAIDASNKRLENVEIHFKMEETAPNGSGVWKATGVGARGVAWFNGKAATKGRISFESRSMHWSGGAAAVLDEECAECFDGSEGRSIIFAVRQGGKRIPVASATIRGNASVGLFGDLATRAATGQEFAIAFMGSAKHGGLVGQLQDDQKDNVLTLSSDQIDGIDVRRITVGNPQKASETWWFDPGRSMALLRYDETVQNVSLDHIDVSKLCEAADGIWYPSEATQEWHMPDVMVKSGSPPVVRYHYVASSVVANRPNFDESIYRIPLPLDCGVRDTVRGTRYRTAPPAEELKPDKGSGANAIRLSN